jgi:protocatechuate 3,4-dioxygenase beta subunit
MHDHDRGLGFDLATLRGRRAALGLFAGAGLAVLAGCATPSDQPTPTTNSTPTTSGATSSGAATGQLTEIPEETAGPYPGDGSNGPNVLDDSGIGRSDIRSSFGAASGVAEGVPLRIELTVVEADTGAALAGAAVYLWHCDREGRRSRQMRTRDCVTGATNDLRLRAPAGDAGQSRSRTNLPRRSGDG